MSQLEAIVGWCAANLNMCPWGLGWQATDFTQGDTTVSAGFALTNATIGSGIVSPSGTNAQKLIENSSNDYHQVYSWNQPIMRTRSQTVFRVATIAKAGERTRIVLACEGEGLETVLTASAGFDLVGGNVGYDTVAGSSTSIADYSMRSLGSGWWLCIVDFKYTGDYAEGNILRSRIYLDNGSGTAARSIIFTGNGTSGVNIWWLNLLPKAAWNMNNRQFFDGFASLDTIDLADTRDPGFKWYIHNTAPFSVDHWVTLATPSRPTNFTLSSPSVLKIWDPNPNSYTTACFIMSTAYLDTGGYIGSAWKAPLVLEGLFSWDGSKDSSQFGFLGPAFWGDSVEAQTGTIGPTDHWFEWDVIDIGATTGGTFDFNIVDGATNIFAKNGWGTNAFTIMNEGEFHRFSSLWLDTASNDGIGLFMSFFDGHMQPYSDMAYFSGAVPQPPGTNPVNSFFPTEQLTMPMWLDTGNNTQSTPGGGWPMFVDWIKAYTAGTSPASFRNSKPGTRSGSRQMA